MKDDPANLAFFMAETGVPSAETERRPRIYEFLFIRLQRLDKLWDRAISARSTS